MLFSRVSKEYTKCEVIALPKKYKLKYFALGLQKDSPYLGIFNYYLLEMIQTGTLEEIVRSYRALPQMCPNLTGRALGFNSLITPFFIMSAGETQGESILPEI